MTFTRKHALRLLRLCTLIVEKEDRFDYSRWAGNDYKGKPDLSCGTSACALGWASTMPFARREGLRLFRTDSTLVGIKDRSTGAEHVEAGCSIFGLSYKESSHLFKPEYVLRNENWSVIRSSSVSDNSTAKEVANHIRGFVSWKLAQIGITVQYLGERFGVKEAYKVLH